MKKIGINNENIYRQLFVDRTNKIKNLASFDENDFKIPCKSEAINLITTTNDLNNKTSVK